MNVKTQAEAAALNQRIIDEMGVDISKYRNEEVAETLGDLLVFPLYAINWVIRPVLISLALWLLGFWFIDLVHVQYLIYGVVGLALALITGFFAGILYLTIRFKGDIHSMMTYSMDILRGVVKDVDQLNAGTNAGNRKDNLTMLFAGVVHIITVPVAASVVGNKVPFIGGYVAKLLTKVLRRIANVFKWPEISRQQTAFQAEEEGKILPVYLTSVTTFESVISKVLGISVGVVQTPVAIIFFGFALTTALFVYLIN